MHCLLVASTGRFGLLLNIRLVATHMAVAMAGL